MCLVLVPLHPLLQSDPECTAPLLLLLLQQNQLVPSLLQLLQDLVVPAPLLLLQLLQSQLVQSLLLIPSLLLAVSFCRASFTCGGSASEFAVSIRDSASAV